MAPADLRAALARYNGHPYAVPAALDLLADGVRINELPDDPTPERIAEAQWRRVGDEHGEDAIKLLEAYTVLEVPVPDDVVEPVSGLNRIGRNVLLANPFLAGLLRDEPEGKRIYHSLLTDHISAQLSKDAAAPYHGRAIDVYRKRLVADIRPDALSATRLPEHVLVVEGISAFVSVFSGECTRPLLILGLLDTAIALSHRALELVGEGTQQEAAIVGNHGVIVRTRGDLDGAEAMHRKALEINEKLGLLEGMATAYANLGGLLRKRGDLAGARQYCEKAIGLYQQIGMPHMVEKVQSWLDELPIETP